MTIQPVEIRVPLQKQDDDAERLVGGVVLEPGEIDLQEDTVSAAEIKRAAHAFASGLNAGTGVDLMHEIEFPEGVHVVETYIAPVDFQMGDQQVKAGSWVVWMHIVDDEIWEDVLNGDINAFSMKGTGQRIPVDGPVE